MRGERRGREGSAHLRGVASALSAEAEATTTRAVRAVRRAAAARGARRLTEEEETTDDIVRLLCAWQQADCFTGRLLVLRKLRWCTGGSRGYCVRLAAWEAQCGRLWRKAAWDH